MQELSLFGNKFGEQLTLFEGQTKDFGENDKRVLKRTQSGKRRWTRAETLEQFDLFPQDGEQLDLFLDNEKISIDTKLEVLKKIDSEIPEAEKDNTLTLAERVKKYLDDKQKGREFKDVGERVGGSKKELAALRKLSAEELLATPFEDQVDLIKRDKVMDAPDFQAMKEAGYDAGAVYVIKTLWDAVARKPKASSRIIKYYVEALPEIFNHIIEKGKTLEDVKDAIKDVFDVGYYKAMWKKKIDESIIDEYVEKIKSSIHSPEEVHSETSETLKDIRKHPYEYYYASQKIYRDNNNDDFKKNIAASVMFMVETEIPKVNDILGKRFNNLIKMPEDFEKDAEMKSEVTEEEEKQNFEKYKKLQYDYINQIKASALRKIEKELEWQLMNNGIYYGVTYKTKKELNKIKRLKPNEFKELLEKTKEKIFAKTKIRIDAIKKEIEKEDALQTFRKDYPAFAAHKENWDFLNSVKRNRKASQTETGKPRIHDNKPLDYIIRENGRIVNDDEIKVESITEKFGFKSVQLGNYVRDKEAREHVRHFIASMKDLEDALGIDLEKLHQQSGLSLSFGARGRGKALAHYEPLRNIINLTKKNGDGTVAHEWGHSLDYFLSGKRKSLIDIVVEGLSQRHSVRWKLRDEGISIDDDELINAIGELGRSILVGDGSGSEAKKTFKPSKGLWYYPTIKSAYENPPEGKTPLESAIEKAKSGYFRSNVYNYIARLEGKPIEVSVKSQHSKYYTESKELGTYWGRPREMFARAFEAYVADKLKEKDMWNNYLVGNTDITDEKRELIWGSGSEKWIAKAYPQGAERAAINEKFDNLFRVIRQKYNLEKEPDGELRTDEKIELTKKSSVWGMLKAFGEQLSMFGNQPGMERPNHKYIERKPDPKRPGKYIYLYELPNGKRQWKNESGGSVKGIDPYYKEHQEKKEVVAEQRAALDAQANQLSFLKNGEPPLKKIADSLERAGKYQKLQKRLEWERLAEKYVSNAYAQKDVFLFDLDEVARENGLDTVSDKFGKFAVKSKESIINKFERNEAAGTPEKNYKLSDVLRSTLVINSPKQKQDILDSLEKRGYKIWENDITDLYEDETPGYKHIALKVVKGDGDKVVKEILLMRPAMLEAKFGFGHDIYDIEKNIKIAANELTGYPDLQEKLMSYLDYFKGLANEYYARAYKKDLENEKRAYEKLSESEALASPPARTVAPKPKRLSKTSLSFKRKSSPRKSSFSVPRKREIRSLSESLKTFWQPISATFKNSSGVAPTSDAVSSAIDLISSSIVKPVEKVISKYN